jgi:hypothetical protein
MIAAKTSRDATDERQHAQRQLLQTPSLTPAAHEAFTVRTHLLPVQSTPRLSLATIADPNSSITMAPRPSITGFDPKKFAAASANGTKGDPWAR